MVHWLLATPEELDKLRDDTIRSAWAYAYAVSARHGADGEQADRIADRVRRNVRKAFRFPLPRKEQDAE
jgi:uncharacterized protein Yka (UPF0111/DUF47 family)